MPGYEYSLSLIEMGMKQKFIPIEFEDVNEFLL